MKQESFIENGNENFHNNNLKYRSSDHLPLEKQESFEKLGVHSNVGT